MRLYAELDEQTVVASSDDWAEDEHLVAFSDFVEDQVKREGNVAPDAVAESFDGHDDPDQRRYAYLRGIDAAMMLVHPALDSSDRGALDALAVRFRQHNRFNTDPADGALLPRYSFPERFRAMPDDMAIERKADLFDSVIVASADEWAQAEPVRLARGQSPPPTVRAEGLFVGCAPVCGGADVTITCEPAPPRRRYRIAPAGAAPAGRVKAIIEQLDECGAHIGLMPELTLDGDLLEEWKETLRSTIPAPGSRLRLLLAGTGPIESQPDGRVVNRGVLLDRAGRVVVYQDKRHPFTLDADTVAAWGLVADLGQGAAAEPIVPGQSLVVVEATFGRMIVLVCEDLGRTLEDGGLLLAVGPSLCLAPVLSKPTLAHYWEHSRAKVISAEIGANTVVANSLVIADRQRTAGIPPDGEGTALAHSPHGFECGQTDDPGRLVLLRVQPEAAVVVRR